MCKLLMPEPYRSEHDGYLAALRETGVARIIGIGREVVHNARTAAMFPCDLAVGRVPGAEPPRFVGFIRDITARKQAEEQLKRSEAELRLAQELANLGQLRRAPRTATEPDYYSRQLYRILRVPVDSPTVTREEFFERLGASRGPRPRASSAFNRPRRRRGAARHRVPGMLLRDGRTRAPAPHRAGRARPEDGRVLKHVGTIHDVTDRRHAEDEARQMQERLTHFSRLSTMGEMAAGLAHEINQPLSAIATYAQACQRLSAPARAGRRRT